MDKIISSLTALAATLTEKTNIQSFTSVITMPTPSASGLEKG